MTEQDVSNSELDFMDLDFEGVDDLPTFETPPAGAYLLEVSLEAKEINSAKYVEAGYIIDETVELKNPSDTPVPNGSRFSELFSVDPTIVYDSGQKAVEFTKVYVKQFFDFAGSTKLGDIVAAVQKVKVSCVIVNRRSKKDPDTVRASTKNITVI